MVRFSRNILAHEKFPAFAIPKKDTQYAATKGAGMLTTSIWQTASEEPGFPALSGHIEADVVIIGAGITGITAAMLLKQAGMSVVVLEAMKTGQGIPGIQREISMEPWTACFTGLKMRGT